MAEWKYGIMLNLFKYLQRPIPMAHSQVIKKQLNILPS